MPDEGTLHRIALLGNHLPPPVRHRHVHHRSLRRSFQRRLEGDVGNVAFPCGTTLGADGDTLNMYYGAADTCIALATGSVREILDWLDRNQDDRKETVRVSGFAHRA